MKSVGSLLKWALAVAAVVLLLLLSFYPRTVRYGVNDWVKTRGYSLEENIQALADSITLTDEAQYTLAATHPELRNKQEFIEVCPANSESSVLGCYAYDRIYILEVEEEQLDGVEEVTAAHELLHAEWARLEDGDRKMLEQELLKVYEDNQNNKRLVDLIESYENSNEANDPDLIPNELHSILPTEVRELSEPLEKHYAQFFKDRQKIVDYFMGYEEEFTERRDRIRELTEQREELSGQIQQLNSEIDQLIAHNDQLVDEISRLREEGEVEESNQLVPEQNAVAAEIRAKVSRVNSLVAEYNKYVNENNNLALELNDLASQLDATQVDL